MYQINDVEEYKKNKFLRHKCYTIKENAILHLNAKNLVVTHNIGGLYGTCAYRNEIIKTYRHDTS